MSVVSGLVLYAVIWFLTFLTIIPVRLQTQEDLGNVTPGTQSGAPEHHHLKRKAWITVAIAAALWVIIVAIIFSGIITVEDVNNWTWKTLDPSPTKYGE